MKNKRIFTIALLGIDGSGKSTISKELKDWLETKGNKVKIIPFHYWVFADKLKKRTSKYIDKGRPSINRPYEPKKRSFAGIVKPVIAFADNLLFYIHNLPDGKNYNVVIFDRFICATQIKLNALNYTTKWFKPFWWNFKPDFAVVFDIPVEISIERQKKRGDPYLYTKDQLSIEKEMYKKFSRNHGFPILDNEKNKEISIKRIKNELKKRELV